MPRRHFHHVGGRVQVVSVKKWQAGEPRGLPADSSFAGA